MFQGSMVALVTPMTNSGAIDDEALARLIEFHIAEGTDAIVAVGTTGESATLDMNEHSEVIARVIELVRGRIPVIAGTGANSTSEAIELTQNAYRAGADASLLVTPYYNKPTQEGLYQHFKKIAETVPLPHILYNVPGRTAVDMLPETVARLAEIDNIVGLKEATASVERARDVLSRCGSGFGVYGGDDATGMALMLAGADGVISVTANIVPRAMHEMSLAARNGDESQAVKLNAPLEKLHSALFLESNPIPVKWALSAMGLIQEGIRLPLTELSEQFHEPVREALKEAGISLSGGSVHA